MKNTCILLLLLTIISCNRDKKEKINTVAEPQSVKIDSGSLLFESRSTVAFYKSNGYQTVWIKENNRKALIDLLLNADKHVLNPSSYALKKLIFADRDYTTMPYKERVKADALFTKNFLKFAKDLSHGRVNPKKYYGDWEPILREINFNSLLEQAISEENFEKAVERLLPKNEYYKGLKESYFVYYNKEKDTLLDLSAAQTAKIKKKLFYLDDLKSRNFSSEWDDESTEALKNFQRRHGISVTGNVTPQTLRELNVSLQDRIEQLVVNLERSKWIPDDLGENYVLVNLPEYKLFYYSKGTLVETHDVIIGKDSRRTPVLSSSFSNLVINPTWTVPPTILKNDLVPQASTNRSYFANHRMTIYNSKGQLVDPENWNPENAKNYRYVQNTGNLNALGLIKFDFPNKHMVYLHDTNNKSLFDRSDRALSSGCVRVKNPFGLAEKILEAEQSAYTRAKLDTLVSRKSTKYIALKKKVNVHQLYWTAWKNDKGVQFRNDVYNLDKGLYKKLSKS